MISTFRMFWRIRVKKPLNFFFAQLPGNRSGARCVRPFHLRHSKFRPNRSILDLLIEPLLFRYL